MRRSPSFFEIHAHPSEIAALRTTTWPALAAALGMRSESYLRALAAGSVWVKRARYDGWVKMLRDATR